MPPIGPGIHLSGQELTFECVLSAISSTSSSSSRDAVFNREASRNVDQTDGGASGCTWNEYSNSAGLLSSVSLGRTPTNYASLSLRGHPFKSLRSSAGPGMGHVSPPLTPPVPSSPPSLVYDPGLFLRSDWVQSSNPSTATTVVSLGAVFGVIVVGISGSIIFQRRRQRKRRELSHALASARASFSSRNVNPRYRRFLEDSADSSSDSSSSIKQFPVPLVDKRLEWIRFGLDSPSHGPSKYQGLRFMEGRPLLHDCQNRSRNFWCCAHPSDAQAHSQMAPSPLGTAPVWTISEKGECIDSINELRGLSRHLSQCLGTRCQLLGELETEVGGIRPNNTLLKDAPGNLSSRNPRDATPQLRNGVAAADENLSLSSDSLTFNASRSIDITRSAEGQYTKLDLVTLAANTHDALAFFSSPPKERALSPLQSMASDLSFDSYFASTAKVAEDQPSSLLAMSFAMLLSPHLESILASASSASLFCPRSLSANSIRTCTTMLPDAPLPPPAIIVSPPSDASLRSDSSALSCGGNFGECVPNLIHSEDDFILPESGSWPGIDGDQCSSEDIERVIEEAKQAEALVESLCASIDDGSGLINCTPAENGPTDLIQGNRACSSRQPKFHSAIPVRSRRFKIATSP